jgi:hypothetical protein
MQKVVNLSADCACTSAETTINVVDAVHKVHEAEMVAAAASFNIAANTLQFAGHTISKPHHCGSTVPSPLKSPSH